MASKPKRPDRQGGKRKASGPSDAQIRVYREHIEAGSTLKDAAEAMGCHPSTLSVWIRYGEEHRRDGERSQYAALVAARDIALGAKQQRLVEIKSEALRALHSTIAIAGEKGDIKSLIAILERLAPDVWSQDQRLQIKIDQAQIEMLTTIAGVLDRDAYSRVIDALSRIPGEGETEASGRSIH